MAQAAHQKHNTRLSNIQKQALALESLELLGISNIAEHHKVARNTVYSQKRTAIKAINDAFADEGKTVKSFPLTKAFISQIIVALYLVCKASYRDIIQFFKDCFDYSISLGYICNLLDDATIHAMIVNDSYDLSPISRAASDEIFHRGKPILATVEIPSRYCASLVKHKSRCQTAWGTTLLDLQDQGFNPETSVIDGATGLKAGYEAALPNTSLLFDHFHIIQDAKALLRHLKHQYESALTHVIKLQ